MELDDLLRVQPKLHQDTSGQPHSWQLSDDVLRFIDTHVREGSETLETGAGVSTVLFALKGASHTCIVPAADEVARIKEFCREHFIPLHKLRFEVDRSEECLPKLRIAHLDLVLIDGAHGFPIPFLDWYYTADRLKIGGTLIIDDTQVWTCQTLKNFLTAEPEWRLEADFPPRSAVFTKLQDGGRGKNEWLQPFVVQETLDFMFRSYPDHVKLIRQFVDPDLFREREVILKFRTFARKAASRVLPSPIKRGLKRRFGF
jgi:hypothetical protein